MNGRELKSYLIHHFHKHGKDGLSPVEIDYLKGRISFNEYLNRCYAELHPSGTTKPKTNRGYRK